MKQYTHRQELNIGLQKPMYVLLFGPLIYLFISNMLYTYNKSSAIFKAEYSTVIMFLVFIISWFSLQLFLLNNGKLPAIIKIATGFSTFTVFSTLINYDVQEQSILIVLTNQLFWWSICILSYLTFKDKKSLKYTNRIILVFFSIVCILYLQYATQTKAYSQLTSSMVNSIYYLVLFIPCILMFKNTTVKNLCISVVVFATFLSLKRTAVLALFSSVLVYYFVNYLITGKKKSRKLYLIFSLIAVLLISMYAYNYILDRYNLDILIRLQNIDADGGSGRNIIYQMVWSEIREFDFAYWIAGRGFNGVLLTSGAGLSAHNDFLEVMYDYGAIGLSLYLAFIFKMIQFNFHLIKAKSEYAGAFSASIALFLIMSMTSHLILYPSYFVMLVSFWMWQIANVNLEPASKKIYSTN